MCGSSPADNIETHVETAAVRVESGNKQLEKAVRHKVGDSYTCILMYMCWYYIMYMYMYICSRSSTRSMFRLRTVFVTVCVPCVSLCVYIFLQRIHRFR